MEKEIDAGIGRGQDDIKAGRDCAYYSLSKRSSLTQFLNLF